MENKEKFDNDIMVSLDSIQWNGDNFQEIAKTLFPIAIVLTADKSDINNINNDSLYICPRNKKCSIVLSVGKCLAWSYTDDGDVYFVV